MLQSSVASYMMSTHVLTCQGNVHGQHGICSFTHYWQLVACRNCMLNEKVSVPRLYFYSADDDLCDAKELEALLDKKRQQCVFISGHCMPTWQLLCA